MGSITAASSCAGSPFLYTVKAASAIAPGGPSYPSMVVWNWLRSRPPMYSGPLQPPPPFCSGSSMARSSHAPSSSRRSCPQADISTASRSSVPASSGSASCAEYAPSPAPSMGAESSSPPTVASSAACVSPPQDLSSTEASASSVRASLSMPRGMRAYELTRLSASSSSASTRCVTSCPLLFICCASRSRPPSSRSSSAEMRALCAISSASSAAQRASVQICSAFFFIPGLLSPKNAKTPR